MSAAKRKFAVFDIDGTLVRWQFFHAIVHELGKSGAMNSAAHQNIRDARMQWKQREHVDSFHDYELALVQIYFEALPSISQVDHQAAIGRVFEEYKDQMFTYSRHLLERAKKDGRVVLAISGSHDSVLKLLADYIGLDDFIGANFEYKNGAYTGVVNSPISDKASALRQLVAKHDLALEGSLGIGDSESDIGMLELVENPIAFNPSAGLLEAAKKRDWKIVLERKNVVYELESYNGQYILA